MFSAPSLSLASLAPLAPCLRRWPPSPHSPPANPATKPAICIDEAIPAHGFFKSWLPAAVAGTHAPRAVLVVSSHWEKDTPAVNVVRGTNDIIHDLQGLPDEMYKLTYHAPGTPGLARRTKELLEGAGFGQVREEHGRGLDHGTWLPLMLMYPGADVPACQLSLQTGRDGAYHYDLGAALAPLRDEGVLILGSAPPHPHTTSGSWGLSANAAPTPRRPRRRRPAAPYSLLALHEQ
ncbi:4,5-DOPA dioxygenase extradiol-like [Triticum dicoccoides]|uniref:4,5-DOPA dioxygenase extradiol-like n=1 Tax=Triticum dicoccoides TaxID=85692 RepID=UPI0018902D95|nr:4,5-DOPA dioxygenase extradiol-like [Triticum dicoccoides]